MKSIINTAGGVADQQRVFKCNVSQPNRRGTLPSQLSQELLTEAGGTTALKLKQGSGAHVAAAVEADADGGQADGARAGVHQHAVPRLQAATHDESIVGGQERHGDRGRVPQGPPLGDLPHLLSSAQASGAMCAVAAHQALQSLTLLSGKDRDSYPGLLTCQISNFAIRPSQMGSTSKSQSGEADCAGGWSV